MTLIIDMNSKSNPFGKEEFIEPIKLIAPNSEVIHYSEIDNEYVKEFDNIILSGTAIKDNEFRNADFKWLKKTKSKVLGICAGMQIIGKAFGGKIIKCREIGMKKVKIVDKNKLFNTETLNAYNLHNYAISIPDKFDVLAKTNYCVQAIKHKTMNIYGVMFHPEVRNNEIIKSFIRL